MLNLNVTTTMRVGYNMRMDGFQGAVLEFKVEIFTTMEPGSSKSC